MNSASASEPPRTGSQTAISNAELESMRRQSIRLLGSVAAALEAAGHQRQTLLAEVQTAQQTLQTLANERQIAEASLAAYRSQLNDAATELEYAEVQRVGILREVEDLRRVSVRNRAALAAEIVVLERERDAFPMVVEGPPVLEVGRAEVLAHVARPAVVDPPPLGQVVARTHIAPPRALTGAEPSSVGEIREPTRPIIIGLVRTYLENAVLAHPIHPGFGNVATALFIALFLAMALLLSPLTQVFGGLQLLAMTSGSMAPGIPTGSIVAVRPVPASDVKVGDVITFANASTPDELVTHRVVSVDMRDGQTMLTTKGDANDSADVLSAPATRAVGRVDFALPWLGDLMVWLGSPTAKIASVSLAILALGLSVASMQRSTRHSLLVR